ncbi:SRPBCC family protein [Salinirussus salinus]|jgi:hypothetical protein|uniref:SRPBCC family protein n=1 Tax=Salinirussus salinus TaxID=1198300 RepID=UPI001359F452|nr:SRPBCC family protein [Salinirussus salinus]
MERRRTPGGRRLAVTREVGADRETVWDLLTDTERWPEWGPSVRAVECDRRYIQAGTTGRVRVPGGIWLPFAVATCRDYRWTWRVARVPATGHFVEPAEGIKKGTCRVGFELPLYAVGYAPVCRRALDRIADLAEG